MQFSITHSRKSHSPVVITGAGIVTALGCDWQSNAQGFRTGRTAFRPVTLFDVSRQRVKFAAEVDLPPDLPDVLLSNRRRQRLDRAAQLLLFAAHQAWVQSGWNSGLMLSVVLGTTSGGMALGETYFRRCTAVPERQGGQGSRVLHYQAQQQGLDLLDAFGCTGPVTIIGNACASGANALGYAWELVRSGRADKVLAGGYDALSHLVFSGFDSLQALSPTHCRPFDRERDGLSLGEGAAIFTIESLDSAKKRDAKILGEIVGYAGTTDAHHLTQPHPRGEAAVRAMSGACQSAGLTPGEIGYLNAHGTGTILNDSAETAAINGWAKNQAAHVQVSSTKGGIGHLLGAAGAVEAAVCLMALQEQWLPPTSLLRNPDPDARFSLVQKPLNAQIEFAMSNSFGFGGSNATLIFRRWA